jgi:hypothetical protein
VLSRVAKLADEFCRELSEFDPAFYSADECTRIAASLARVANACGAAGAKAVMRASVSKRPEKFLSELNGSTVTAARDALRAVASVESGSEAERALVAGEISVAQAAEIVKAPVRDHDALVSMARNGALQPVRDAARKRALAEIPVEELHAKQHEAMHFRHWENDLGNIAFEGELPPELGVPWINRLDRAIDRAWRKEKRKRSREQVAAEVLARSDTDTKVETKTKPGPKVDIVYVVDINAYRRGHAHDGEVCHIIGGGPIPADVLKEMTKDAFVTAVIHDGVNVHTIKHFGRYRKAELQTMLDLGPAPRFEGAVCSCGRRYNLQWDHIDPVANGGPTSAHNLQPKCIPEHVEKTERDRKAGLLKRKPQGP